MVEFLLITFAVLAITVSLLIGRATMWGSIALSPLFVFVACSVVFVNVGFVVLYLRNGDASASRTALAVVSAGILSVAIGGVIGNALSKGAHRWRQLTSTATTPDLPYSLAMGAALVVFAVVLSYFVLLGYVPLFSGISYFFTHGFVSGLTNTFRVQRDVYVNPEGTYIPLQGFLEVVRYFGLPIVAIWFLAFRRRGMQPRTSLVMVLMSGVLTVLTGQRWPLMYLLAALLVYWSWTEPDPARYGRFVRRTLAASFCIGIVLSALLGRTFEAELGWWEMLGLGFIDLLERVVVGYVEVPFASYEVYFDVYPPLLGASWWQNLIAYLPGPEPSFPVTFYQIVTGDTVGFTAAPDFYTESFINFGWPGVVAIGLAWGVFLGFLQAWIMRATRSLYRLAEASMLTMMIGFASISGISFLLGGLIVVVFVKGVLFGIIFLRELVSPTP